MLGTLRDECSSVSVKAKSVSRHCQKLTGTNRFISLNLILFFFFTDLSSVSEQKKQGLSQLASMLELYLQQEAPDLMREMTSLPPSCREPLSLIAKVSLMHYNT